MAELLADSATLPEPKETETETETETSKIPFTTQLLTYMGNKRKLLPHIRDTIHHVSDALGGRPISFADPFSGSGVVARLAFTCSRVNHIAANDIAHYAHLCNLCYLQPPPSPTTRQLVHSLIDRANALPDPAPEDQWIARHWAPANDADIQPGERCYFTRENALRIDAIRNFIASDEVPCGLKPFLLAPLLIQASLHNNTNGQFAAFYKNEAGVGAFGGKRAIDTKRITKRIVLPYPLHLHDFRDPNCPRPCVSLSRKDARQWAIQSRTTATIDLLYLDPPYNKHPYNIYYFLLDIIATWDKTIDIPASYRGQPKGWLRSPFNSSVDAHSALRDVVRDANARFVALSYYDAGILAPDTIDALLAEFGEVQRFPVSQSVYNKLYGLGAHKRDSMDTAPAKEYLWLLRKK